MVRAIRGKYWYPPSGKIKPRDFPWRGTSGLCRLRRISLALRALNGSAQKKQAAEAGSRQGAGAKGSDIYSGSGEGTGFIGQCLSFSSCCCDKTL